MLNDWGVHHLHIGSELRPDGFTMRERTADPEPLIFAVFKPSATFVIDIMRHGDWVREHIVQVMVRNWPHARLAHRLYTVHDVTPSVTEDERKALRKHRSTASIPVDGAHYFPAHGLNLGGYSSTALLKADKVLDLLEGIAACEARDIWRGLAKGLGPCPENAEFHVEVRERELYVVEHSTDTAFQLTTAN